MGDTMTIAKLAEIHRAVEDERKREYEAAVKLAAEREWTELRGKVESILCPEVRELFQLKGVYDQNSQAKWETSKQAITGWRIDLIAKDLPEGVSLTLIGRLEHEYQGDRLRIGLHDPGQWSAGTITIAADQSSEEQAYRVGMVALPEIERQQKEVADKAERQRRDEENRRAWAERERRESEQRRQREEAVAAARARLEARIPAVTEALEVQRANDVAARGWPPGASLTLYFIHWIAAIDGEGNSQSYDWYSPYSAPNSDGWWHTLRSDGLQRMRVESPNGYLVQELVVDDPKHLPEGWMYREQGYATEISEPLPEGVTDGWGNDRVYDVVQLERTRLLHPLIVELIRKEQNGGG